jgi:hypothetical protein
LNSAPLQVDSIHHHHDREEQVLFPEFEKKLGEGALHGNIDQHGEFGNLPLICMIWKAVQNGKQKYNGDDFVTKISTRPSVIYLCNISLMYGLSHPLRSPL